MPKPGITKHPKFLHPVATPPHRVRQLDSVFNHAPSPERTRDNRRRLPDSQKTFRLPLPLNRRSDTHTVRQMISYSYSSKGIEARQLTGFFVGWPNPPSPEAHLRILNGSSYVVLATDDETNDVAGFITAISDNELSAYIPLLEVRPEYQGQGIGSELARRMLLKLEKIYMVDLLCDQALQSFYEKIK